MSAANTINPNLDANAAGGAAAPQQAPPVVHMQYGLRLPDMEIEIVAWRLSAHGPEVQRDSIVPRVPVTRRRQWLVLQGLTGPGAAAAAA